MTAETDQTYINRMSFNLDRFTWQREYLAVFRCPLCGDSQKSERKRRGYFYRDSEEDCMRFKCHNCSEASGWSVQAFLKKYEPELYREYVTENFANLAPEKRRSVKAAVDVTGSFQPATAPKQKTHSTRLFKKDEVQRTCPWLDNLTCIADMSPNSEAAAYILGRQIPSQHLRSLYYTDNMKLTTVAFQPEDMETFDNIPEDRRIIIPFFDGAGKVVAFQGRALDKHAPMRYITVKKNDSVPKTYGLERIDRTKTVMVVEGPFDSLFLPNCLASADADLLKVKGDIYIPDAQARNPEIVRNTKKIVESGAKVCLLPNDGGKDINDMILSGMSQRELLQLIAKHVHQGLMAELEFARWARV